MSASPYPVFTKKSDPFGLKKRQKRISRVMEKEMICSEHGAACFIEACRCERKTRRPDETAKKKP